MSNGKALGADGIPIKVFKIEGQYLVRQLVQLFKTIWQKESVPHDFKNANITHRYKKKGDRSSCDNHCGISLLATAGKVLANTNRESFSEKSLRKYLVKIGRAHV